MFELLVRFKHLILHFYLSVPQFLQNLNILVGILLQRDPVVLILIKVVHYLLGQLSCFIWSHSIPILQMIFYLLKLDESISGTLTTVVALVYLVELDAQLHFLSLVELLLPLEFRLRFKMFRLVSNLLPFLQCFLVIHGSEVVSHVFGLGGVFHSHLGLGMHVIPVHF